jgi:hypothetical protein
MTVQRGLQSLLVKVVADKTDATSENEETVQHTNLSLQVSDEHGI